MELKLQLVFVIVSVFTLVFIIRRIRKHKLNIDDAIIWILWAILLLILSMFPEIAVYFSNAFGFASPSNFIFSLFTFFLYIILFTQTIHISALKEKNKALIQKLSLMNYNENRDNKK